MSEADSLRTKGSECRWRNITCFKGIEELSEAEIEEVTEPDGTVGGSLSDTPSCTLSEESNWCEGMKSRFGLSRNDALLSSDVIREQEQGL